MLVPRYFWLHSYSPASPPQHWLQVPGNSILIPARSAFLQPENAIVIFEKLAQIKVGDSSFILELMIIDKFNVQWKSCGKNLQFQTPHYKRALFINIEILYLSLGDITELQDPVFSPPFPSRVVDFNISISFMMFCDRVACIRCPPLYLNLLDCSLFISMVPAALYIRVV